MHGFLAHDLKQRCRLGECLRAAACHEGQRTCRRPADTAGDRRVHRAQSGRFCLRGHGARVVHVHGRAIDQNRTGCHGGDDFAGHGAQDRAVGQHGYDHFGPCCGGCARRRLGHAVHGHAGGIIACDLVTGLDQIGRHRRAHVSKPDESDFHGASPPSFNAFSPSGRSIAATAATGTGPSAYCHLGLRSLSMICARMPSRKSPFSIARDV